MIHFNVSVIIPVYDVENYINRAIDSVLQQEDVTELILVEDGSSDNSLQQCLERQKLDSRITVLTHEENKNKGVSASRNVGIKKAKNEFIAFLDGDDYYLPERFKQTKSSFSCDVTIEGVYEMVSIHSKTGNFKPYSMIQFVKHNLLFENLQPLGSKVWFHIDGLTVKKTLFIKAGYFDETLKTSEDTLQWFKMAAVGRLVSGNIQQPVSITESRLNSLSSNKEQVHQDFITMLFILFQSCNNLNCSATRRELVLNKLFFVCSNKSEGSVSKIITFFKVIKTNPSYVLLHSAAVRRYVGDLVGYNRLLKKLKLLNSRTG